MTAREYTAIANRDAEARRLVDEVADPGVDVSSYRELMRRMGRKLAQAIVPQIHTSVAGDVFVVCTVEDADFLARGVIDELSDAQMGSRVRLICLWNEKVREGAVSLSPIIKQYKEQSQAGAAAFIVVKSIISGACVVKTNLTRALSYQNPAQVFVASPVLLSGAQERLAAEFPPEISAKFEYVWFATDSDKQGENVLPGIGGSVYERLGFGDECEKNKYVPEIVKERRRSHSTNNQQTSFA
ncbi:hypothetical protein [uncultured Pseudacidovorax sp.]|uniref:hypothetical protein n=1 Tax=uncultured Pseudacidovorax sp. TaxID=679313 RepID=UPI0025CFB295|nr:hypothetical protein [uncultured Pseudacidovorax sp.]